MERSPGAAWGTSSPEGGVDSSSSSSSKESKSKKGGEAPKVEPVERQPQGIAKLFVREALQRPAEKEVTISLRGEAAKNEPEAKAEQPAEAEAAEHQEASTIKQEREIAAEVVDKAQAQNEQSASQAGDAVAQASAENVGQLLDHMEDGLVSAPTAETAEHIIDRTTDETAASLIGERPPDAEISPLDWPQYQHESQDVPAAEAEPGDSDDGHFEPAGVPPWQHDQFDRHLHDDEPDPTNTAAPYAAPGGGQGAGGGQPPRGSAAEFNANAMPPLGGAAPAAANLIGWRARAHEASDALARGFLLGVLTGGIFGHWLGKRGERARATRAMNERERLHQEQVAKYESQVAESQTRIRTLTERQAYAARQAVRAAELAPVAARTAEQQRMPAATETRRAEMRTGVPKRVEMMTDTEVHEASRNLRIGDKTLYELKENGTIDAVEERTLLRLAEQGGIEDPVRKYHFDQEAQRVLMRHELDPQLAQQVLQHEREERSSGQEQDGQGSGSTLASPLGQYSPIAESISREPGNSADVPPLSSSQSTDRAPASHPLVIANIVAVGVLVGLLLVWLIISITR